MNSIAPKWLLLSGRAQSKLETKFTNKIKVSDVLRVMEGEVSARYQFVCMMTVMLYSSMRPTA